MTTLGAIRLTRRRLPADAGWLAVHVTLAVWTAVTLVVGAGLVQSADRWATELAVIGPSACAVAVLVVRPYAPPWLKWAALWTTAVAGAVIFARHGANTPLVIAGLIGVTIVTLSTVRWPGVALAGLIVLTGSHPTFQLYSGIPMGPVIEAILISLWIGLIGTLAIGGRARLRPIDPGLWLIVGYCVVSLVYAVAGDPVVQSLYGYRMMPWYMLCGVLAWYLLDDDRQRRIAVRGALVALFLVGAYAMFRWAVGQSAAEEGASTVPYSNGLQGSRRLSGSLLNPTVLGIWCASIVPFAVAFVLAPLGRPLRLFALAGVVMGGLAIVGAETRVAIVAVGAGVAAALTLFAISRAYAGRRIVPLATALVVVTVAGGIFFAREVTDQGSRLSGLLRPTQDWSVVERTNKWAAFLDGLETKPFGHGLGSTGGGAIHYERFLTLGWYEPDSAYVKVAYDQGYVVAFMWMLALLAAAAALAVRALASDDSWISTPALGAFGTLISFIVSLSCGSYNEGMLGFLVWTMIALGLAGTATRGDRAAGSTPPQLEAN